MPKTEKTGDRLRGMGGALAGCGCAVLFLLAGLLPAAGKTLSWAGRLGVALVRPLPPLLLVRGLGLSAGELGLSRPGRGGAVPALCCVAVAALGALLLPAAVQALPQGGAARALAFLALGPAAALGEELTFRGAAQSCFASSELGGPGLAVAAQAVLFAGMHSGPAGQLYALGMGLALGWLRQRTGSIWPGAALHLLNNTIVFVGML